MANGGDIIEITFNHPTLGNGTIYPKSAEDSTYELGGFRNNDDANSIDGAGGAINTKNRVRWSFEVPIAWNMQTDQELEKMIALAGDPVSSDWTFTNINGTVYAGNGTPVGDLQGNGNASTFPLKIAGGGRLKKIV